MDEWRQYLEMKSLRDDLEARVVSTRRRLCDTELDSPERQLIRQELAAQETVLDEFVTRLSLTGM
jgi:hypothetical protein